MTCLDAEQIENIISMINDMGIQVYDEAPDAETLLMNETTPAVVPDEDVVEEAEQALSTVDSEFGRTTDPVRMYIYMSPGPIYEVQSLDENFYNRYPKRLNAQGFRAGDIIVNTWSYHMVPAGHWFDEAIRRIGAVVIPMGVGNTELQVRVLYDMKATGWIGISGFLMNIIDKAEEMGYDIQNDFALRKAIAGGEMGGGAIEKRLEEKYGIVCYDGYGTADVGPVAYECTQRNGMHIFEEVFVEIVDPDSGKALKSGEVGEVVVTPFDIPILSCGLELGPCFLY